MHAIATLGWDRPLGLAIAVAALGGMILADLTEDWGVLPVWSPFLIVIISRSALRGGRRHPV